MEEGCGFGRGLWICMRSIVFVHFWCRCGKVVTLIALEQLGWLEATVRNAARLSGAISSICNNSQHPILVILVVQRCYWFSGLCSLLQPPAWKSPDCLTFLGPYHPKGLPLLEWALNPKTLNKCVWPMIEAIAQVVMAVESRNIFALNVWDVNLITFYIDWIQWQF